MKKDASEKFLKNFSLKQLKSAPMIVSFAAFLVTAAVIIIFGSGSNAVDLAEFETGKVADRDVIADEPVSYIDEEATRIRLEAQQRLVPAVFKYALSVNQEMHNTYERFMLFSRDQFRNGSSRETYKLRVQSEFPGLFTSESLDAVFNDPERNASLDWGREALDYFIELGIFALPQTGLERYNPDMAELLHNYGERVERERLSYAKIITKDKTENALAEYIKTENLSSLFAAGAGAAAGALIRENVFFSPGDTEQRLAEVRSQLEPVYRYIERGDRIVRKGFIITDGEMQQLRALNMAPDRQNPRLITGEILLLLLMYILFVLLLGRSSAAGQLKKRECYMMIILAAGYLILAALAKNLVTLPDYFPLSIILPSALAVMLPAILLGFPMAIITAILLPLGALLSETIDFSAYIFALCSGYASAFALQGAERRMDLVRAGLITAAVNVVAAVTILLLQEAPAGVYPLVLFWAAFNGIASGMLVLGILPVTEQALNAVTPFRLIELSDLNAPVLKRLFNAAPGTYSHSLMVANLAESACQEIGANALLARVGAYYHDIGKMEQPEYFIENQTSYNKHTDIAPRLSATVIRSHVKMGIEKARALGLPEAIVDFIGEHHGNSVITWFYNEALKREGQVNTEDFTYPGKPPRSRESAVVMLADVTEAAVRTLKKPTVARLEKFIQGLFDAKVATGQLSQCELTFRDLDTIKNAFIRVLTGYYHSRIEYPKLPGDAAKHGGA